MKKLFIHIPKNGGMTLRKNSAIRQHIILSKPSYFKSKAYYDGVKKTMETIGDHPGYEHARWRDLNPELLNKYTSFAIVRNPWARVVSRFMFAKKVIYEEETSDHYGDKNYADVSSFEAFLEERHKWGNKKYMWHRAIRGWYPALDHVSDLENEVQCDIIRLEHFNNELPRYLRMNYLKGDIERRNVTGYKQDYKSFYNKKTIQIIADWYSRDIDYWGFDFDSSATRNTYYTWKKRMT